MDYLLIVLSPGLPLLKPASKTNFCSSFTAYVLISKHSDPSYPIMAAINVKLYKIQLLVDFASDLKLALSISSKNKSFHHF